LFSRQTQNFSPATPIGKEYKSCTSSTAAICSTQRAELSIVRPTIAYSQPKNIGDYITKAKLHQAPGQTSSIIMGEFKK
jgi:hypothetical protein